MGNHNQPSNVNPNVQMIYVDSWEPIIVVLTMGDVATWDDQGSQLENPRVWPMVENKVPFDI